MANYDECWGARPSRQLTALLLKTAPSLPHHSSTKLGLLPVMLWTDHRSATGMRSYKRTTSKPKNQTSSVLNGCTNRGTNTAKITNPVADESLPKKAKLDEEAQGL